MKSNPGMAAARLETVPSFHGRHTSFAFDFIRVDPRSSADDALGDPARPGNE
jgi:hypothetical protein